MGIIDYPNQLTIRRMTKADLDSVVHVERQAHTHGWMRKTFRESLQLGHESWVVLDPDSPAFTIAHTVLGIGVDSADLFNITVHPRYQGQGIGRFLLHHILARARTYKIDSVYLEVRKSNQRAIELYESIGFNHVADRKNYYEHAVEGREDALVLRLDIFTAPVESAEHDRLNG